MGLFSALKNKFTPIKMVSSNNFVDTMKQNFKEIEDVKTKVIERDEISEDAFNSMVDEGIEMFFDFASDPSNESEKLVNAIEIFTESLNIKKNKPTPYFYLSYIAYLTGDLDVSIKYFQIVKVIDSNFPGLNKLQEQINQAIS